jgi:Icc protein
MILVQISDTHIDEPGNLVYGQFDTTDSLAQAINVINAMVPSPDFVIHTGDIASHGSIARYRAFQGLMNELHAPFCVMPGNHDDRDALRDALGGGSALPATGEYLHYTVDHLPVRLICCDSVIAGQTPGALCQERLAWLSDRLDEAPTKPTIVALHHPPFYTGMTGTTANGLLDGGAELDALLRRHTQVVRLICGHVHRPITTSFGGTIAFAGPTTCYPFGLDIGPERVLNVVHEPPAVAVHMWLPEVTPVGAELVTHVLPIGNWDAPITLLRAGKRVLPT